MTPATDYSAADRRFADTVRELRKARGWSQEELAYWLTVEGIEDATQVTVSRLESGKRAVRLAEAQALAAIFDRPLGAMTRPGVASLTMARAQAVIARCQDVKQQLFKLTTELVRAEDEAFQMVKELEAIYESEDLDGEMDAFGDNLILTLNRIVMTANADSYARNYSFEYQTNAGSQWRDRVSSGDGYSLLIEDPDGEHQAEG